MHSSQIRQKYLDFFKERGHSIIPSASLLPENDPSLLFVNSGMFPLVPYLLGEKHPGGKRLANIQKSFRAEDIEEVGDSRHTTMFEMLGNWSLGDYFKQEQLHWWYKFLIEELRLDPKRLYQTVFAGDERAPKDMEAVYIMKDIFEKYRIPALEGPETVGRGEEGPGVEIDFEKFRIFAYRDKNWWQRGDAVGELGGPDSETFYDTGKPHDPKFGKYCHPNCDCGRFIEIGNSVFMQYQKTAEGWKEIAQKNVDFGGGLERLAMILQAKDNVFETDLFIGSIRKIEELSGKKYRQKRAPFEVIADHLKAATFIMGDDRGVAPSNVEHGYIVRRLVRRAVRYGRLLGITQKNWTQEIAEAVISCYGGVYPELRRNRGFILNNLKEEEEKFARTIEHGLKEFKKVAQKKSINGEDGFNLFQTYGFPLELTIEEINSIPELKNNFNEKRFREEFTQAMHRHQDLSRTASAGKFKGGLADHSQETTRLHTAAHLLLESLRRVLGDHVKQCGSNITAERLRFDFSHPEKLTEEEKKEVEEMVNQQIAQDLPVSFQEMSLEEAKAAGATGVFESRYGERVKVYTIGEGENIFSREICGGPHVQRTGELGHFKIIKEQSSSAGVRRIKAILE